MATAPHTRTGIRIQPIESADAARLEGFYDGLSPDSMNARFHGAARGISDGTARRFCGTDHAHREGLVAVVDDGIEQIVGHLCLEPLATGEVEMAIAVADAWQHQGIGHALLEAALVWAADHGVRRLRASIRWSNPAIVGLLRSIGRPLVIETGVDGDTVVTVAVDGRLLQAA